MYMCVCVREMGLGGRKFLWTVWDMVYDVIVDVRFEVL